MADKLDLLNPRPAIGYREALAREKNLFGNCLHVHDLPDIFHYWSLRYLRPKLLPFGFDSPDAMFAKYLAEQCREEESHPKRFVSLGAGNCELEIELALKLRSARHDDFIIDCVDLNPAMLARGYAAAASAGVDQHLKFTESDLNSWVPTCEFDAVFANQSLHHVLNLEGLFAQIKSSLKSGASFIISDMIGRNGHQRWPEALELVHEFWRKLPPSYRFNSKLNRYEELFEDWDCSVEGFEGIRSQDILPLFLREFHFRLFLPFANIIDPFVDRSFGYHFDATAQWDRAFIDEVHRRDEAEISSGALTPTHMLAVVGNDLTVPRTFPGLTPEFCMRHPEQRTHRGHPPQAAEPEVSPVVYDYQSWPHWPKRELEFACLKLAEFSSRLRERTAEVAYLQPELEKRTDWARNLQKQLNDLEKEFADRTRWALALEAGFEERTAWALRLKAELEEKTRDLSQLESELNGYLHHPLRFVARLSRGVYRRARRMFHLSN